MPLCYRLTHMFTIHSVYQAQIEINIKQIFDIGLGGIGKIRIGEYMLFLKKFIYEKIFSRCN